MGLFNDGAFPVLCENFGAASFEFLASFYLKSVPQETHSRMEIYLQQVWRSALIYKGVKQAVLGRETTVNCAAIAMVTETLADPTESSGAGVALQS